MPWHAYPAYDVAVTFLSILAHEGIALPLSHSFPASELQYILENSEPRLLLSTPKFEKKANEALKAGLQRKPVLAITERREEGSPAQDNVEVTGTSSGNGGLMLYTSGTTSRPVRRTLL